MDNIKRVNIRKSKMDLDMQKHLRDSEKWDTTINLTNRNSIHKNKRLRKRVKMDSMMYKLITGIMIVWGIFVAIWMITPNTVSWIERLDFDKEYYSDQEIEEIVEVIEDEYKQEIIEESTILTTDEYLEEQNKIQKEMIKERVEMSFENKLFDFITKWEWTFQPVSFCDSYYRKNGRLIRETWKYCDRWSIGFWTLSYWGEKITIEEWEKRRNEDIKNRNSLITSDCLTESQRIATVDFMYQHWNNSSWIKEYANRCEINKIYNIIVWWRDAYKWKFLVNWKSLKSIWLAKREQKRINLFYN